MQQHYWEQLPKHRRRCKSHHAVPQHSGASLAQLLTGCQLRDAIPVDASLYEVSEGQVWLLREREQAIACSRDSAALRHNQTAHNFEPLTPGQQICNQNPGSDCWDHAGTVLETTAPRQYLVRLDGSGHTTVRNQHYLCPLTYEPCTQTHRGVTVPGPIPRKASAPQTGTTSPVRLCAR